MQIIGITGGIGSGKSTIARELANRGYAVYDCDREAKRIVEKNESVRQQIIALLGEQATVHSAEREGPGGKDRRLRSASFGRQAAEESHPR